MVSAASYNNVVQELYVAYFGRPADPLGLTNFTVELAKADPSGSLTTIGALQTAYSTNATVKTLVDGFGTSAESIALYGSVSASGGMNHINTFVNNIYENLFNRGADTSGLQFWSNAIASGNLTLGDAALSIAAGAAANTTTQGVIDATTVANKIAVSESFTSGLSSAAVLGSVADPFGYNGSTNPGSILTARSLLSVVTNSTVVNSSAETATIANAVTLITTGSPGASVILTTGVDTAIGQNFSGILAATGSTLNAFDSLTGTAPIGNTLTITSDGVTPLPANIELTNIQTIDFHSASNQSVDLSSQASVTALNITDIGAAAITAAVTVGANTAVSISGHILGVADSSGVGSLTVDGGTNITVTTSGSDNDTSLSNLGAITIGGTTAPTGAVVVNATANLSDANSSAGNIKVSGGTAVTVNAIVNYADDNGTGDIFTARTINVLGAKGAVIVDSIFNLTDNNNDDAAYSGDNILVNGGTTVNVGLTATANTRALNGLGGAGSGDSFQHGSVTVLDNGTATSVVVDEQVATGVAAILPSAGTPATTVVGGIGYDSSTTAATAAITAALGVLGVSAGTVEISGSANNNNLSSASKTITTVALDNYATANINSAALTNLTLAGTGDGLTLYNVAATPLTLNLNGFTDNAGITETGNTNTKILNLVLGTDTADTNAGTAAASHSSLAGFADSNLTTLNVSGTGNLSLGDIAANTSLATIAVTGAAGFTGDVSGLHGTLTSFTTTSSGIITATVDAATQTFVGSTGQDVITIGADALKTISGGSGANNEIILSGDATTFTAAHTVANVTNFTTLGIAGNGTGTNEVYNMSVLTGFNNIDVQSGASGAGSDAFTNVTTGTTLSIDSNLTGSGTVAAVEGSVANVSLLYQAANATGVSDSLSLTLGKAVSSIGGLLFEDGNAVGIATLNVSVSDTTTATGITNLVDNGLTNLNISGTGALSIGTLNETSTQATSFAINNTTTGGGGSNITNFTDTSLGQLTFNGTGNSSVANLTDLGHIVTITNSGTGTATVGEFIDGNLQILTLGAGVALGPDVGANGIAPTTATGLAATGGVTIAAAADNAHINLNLNQGAMAGATDKITVGNGNDYIIDNSSAGTINVTVGTGSNLISLNSGATASTYHANVTLGTHTASGPDFITVGDVAAGAILPSVVISGAVAGDTVSFGNGITSTVALTTAEQTTVTGEATLAAAIHYVDDLSSTVAQSATAFQYGGNTYIIDSSATGNGTLTANDGFVELAGLASATGIITSGVPVINLTLTTGTTSYNGGAANDFFTGAYSDSGAGNNTFLATDTINGFGGSNTLTINPYATNTSTTLVDNNFGNGSISNIQNLVFGSTGTGNFSLGTTAGNHFNTDFATLNMTAQTTSGTLDLAMNTYETVATITTISTTGNQSINIGTAGGTAAQSVTSNSTAGNIGITVGNGTDTVSATATTGTISVTSGLGIDSVTAQASGAVTITSNSTTGDSLLSATSTSTSALTINASQAATTGTYNITANASAGTDIINVSGGTGTEVYNITLGTHTGVATIHTAEIGTGAQATTGTYAANTIITGALANDVIYVADSSATGAVGLLGAAASVNAGVAAAYAAAGANGMETFTFGGNTYLVETVAGTASAATSTVIELVGSHTFGTASSGHVTLAS